MSMSVVVPSDADRVCGIHLVFGLSDASLGCSERQREKWAVCVSEWAGIGYGSRSRVISTLACFALIGVDLQGVLAQVSRLRCISEPGCCVHCARRLQDIPSR